MPGLLQPTRTVTWLSPDTVTISAKSLITGNWSTRTLTMTRAQWQRWQDGEYIQRAMPHLSASDREFLLSGATDEEWASLKDDDDD